MLGHDILAFLDNIYGKQNYFFQQDNASIYVCKTVMGWFREHEIKLLDSPGLNLTENVWKMLSDIVYNGKQFKSKNDLWKAIQEPSKTIMNSNHLVQEMFTSVICVYFS